MTPTVISHLDIPVQLYISGAPEALLIQPLERKEVATADHVAALIAHHANRPFAMAVFRVDDWHLQMSPWHDDAISRREDVGQHAGDTFAFITSQLLPVLRNQFGNLPVILGGYSLAALFALWASTQTTAFEGIAAASPSVWIRQWQQFAFSHPTRAKVVYLSIGRKEEQVRNVSMARVGDNIRATHRLLDEQLGANTTMEWNDGGHFVEMDTRTARAFAWVLKRLHEQQ